MALSLCHPVIWSSLVPPAACPPEALAKPAHVAPGGLELLLAHHFPGADAGQDQAALHGGPKHVLRFLEEVLVDVLPTRDRRDRGRGDGRVPPGALVPGSNSLAAPPRGREAPKEGEQPSCRMRCWE